MSATTSYSPQEIRELLAYATPEERALIDQLLAADRTVWRPLPGPQSLAYHSVADVVGYGGAAGGGKTDLAIGKALTKHKVTAMFRRVGTELTAIEDRLRAIIGNDKGYNGQKRIWRQPVEGVQQIEFGSVPNAGDETNYQGRPKDLLVIDEAANFLESQVRFLMGWVRTTTPGQLCQTLMCFNPPTSAEGRWIVEFFAPWIDPGYAGVRAAPGELRYFAMIKGKELEVPDARPFVIDRNDTALDAKNCVRLYEFDRKQYKPDDIIQPQSRTFIPARISDNPYLLGTGYMATLQAMPEPLRSQMLYGDFAAGMKDDPWQVIPTAWVEAAMKRWSPKLPKPEMTSIGCDVARGGDDNTIISRRHGEWFDELLAYPGKQTPDGPSVAGLVMANMRDNAPIQIDVIGVGASPYDFLKSSNQQVMGVNVSEASRATDRSGRLTFSNLRSELWWRAREALDPANNRAIALPPDARLLKDLCTPKWHLQSMKIYVQSREEIIKEIQRSPDYASAVILALIDVPKIASLRGPQIRDHDPYAGMGVRDKQRREHDPYSNMR